MPSDDYSAVDKATIRMLKLGDGATSRSARSKSAWLSVSSKLAHEWKRQVEYGHWRSVLLSGRKMPSPERLSVLSYMHDSLSRMHYHRCVHVKQSYEYDLADADTATWPRIQDFRYEEIVNVVVADWLSRSEHGYLVHTSSHLFLCWWTKLGVGLHAGKDRNALQKTFARLR